MIHKFNIGDKVLYKDQHSKSGFEEDRWGDLVVGTVIGHAGCENQVRWEDGSGTCTDPDENLHLFSSSDFRDKIEDRLNE